MNLMDFLRGNFPEEEIENFRKKYTQEHTRQAYNQLKRVSLENFKTYRWQLLADHFTGGDVEKIFSMYCHTKQTENVYPKYKEV